MHLYIFLYILACQFISSFKPRSIILVQFVQYAKGPVTSFTHRLHGRFVPTENSIVEIKLKS